MEPKTYKEVAISLHEVFAKNLMNILVIIDDLSRISKN